MYSNLENCYDHVIELFTKLYKELERNRPKLDGLSFVGIDEEQAKHLERDYDEVEIKGAIDSLALDKSPGLKGFSIEVYHRCWSFMKP